MCGKLYLGDRKMSRHLKVSFSSSSSIESILKSALPIFLPLPKSTQFKTSCSISRLTALQLQNPLLHLQAGDLLLLRLKYRLQHIQHTFNIQHSTYSTAQTNNIFAKTVPKNSQIPHSKTKPICSPGTGGISTFGPGWASTFPVLLHVGAVDQVSPRNNLNPKFLS